MEASTRAGSGGFTVSVVFQHLITIVKKKNRLSVDSLRVEASDLQIFGSWPNEIIEK